MLFLFRLYVIGMVVLGIHLTADVFAKDALVKPQSHAIKETQLQKRKNRHQFQKEKLKKVPGVKMERKRGVAGKRPHWHERPTTQVRKRGSHNRTKRALAIPKKGRPSRRKNAMKQAAAKKAQQKQAELHKDAQKK